MTTTSAASKPSLDERIMEQFRKLKVIEFNRVVRMFQPEFKKPHIKQRLRALIRKNKILFGSLTNLEYQAHNDRPQADP